MKKIKLEQMTDDCKDEADGTKVSKVGGKVQGENDEYANWVPLNMSSLHCIQ